MHTDKNGKTDHSDKKKYLLDNQRNVWLLIKGLFVICVMLIIADFFVPKHGDFYWENIPMFYSAFGLVAFAGLVLVAKHFLRPIIKRDEDYYDK